MQKKVKVYIKIFYINYKIRKKLKLFNKRIIYGAPYVVIHISIFKYKIKFRA